MEKRQVCNERQKIGTGGRKKGVENRASETGRMEQEKIYTVLFKKEGTEDGKIRRTAFRRGGEVGKKGRVYERGRQDSEVRDSGKIKGTVAPV